MDLNKFLPTPQMDKRVIFGLIGAVLATIALLLWCHKNVACGGKCKSKESAPLPPPRIGPAADLTPRGYTFQNTGGAFQIQMVEKSTALPETPTLTLYIDNQGQATVSSAMTTYKPRIRRHNARYNKNVSTGNETRIPVDLPATFWCTYSIEDGLQLGSGATPTPLSTLTIADTYVPLGSFSMQIQGAGISGMKPIPVESAAKRREPWRYRLKKPYE